jgi:hypothetical protein
MGLAKFNLVYPSILIHKSIYLPRHMKMHLTATEAADFLNISKPTLYAYVSRGLVQSEHGLNQRSRVYHRLDTGAIEAAQADQTTTVDRDVERLVLG